MSCYFVLVALRRPASEACKERVHFLSPSLCCLSLAKDRCSLVIKIPCEPIMSERQGGSVGWSGMTSPWIDSRLRDTITQSAHMKRH